LLDQQDWRATTEEALFILFLFLTLLFLCNSRRRAMSAAAALLAKLAKDDPSTPSRPSAPASTSDVTGGVCPRKVSPWGCFVVPALKLVSWFVVGLLEVPRRRARFASPNALLVRRDVPSPPTTRNLECPNRRKASKVRTMRSSSFESRTSRNRLGQAILSF
jgi:hypothetical protein